MLFVFPVDNSMKHEKQQKIDRKLRMKIYFENFNLIILKLKFNLISIPIMKVCAKNTEDRQVTEIYTKKNISSVNN